MFISQFTLIDIIYSKNTLCASIHSCLLSVKTQIAISHLPIYRIKHHRDIKVASRIVHPLFSLCIFAIINVKPQPDSAQYLAHPHIRPRPLIFNVNGKLCRCITMGISLKIAKKKPRFADDIFIWMFESANTVR